MSSEVPSTEAHQATTTLPELMPKQVWHEDLEFDVVDCPATGKELSVLIIDVNYFKEVNDSLGHQRGDQIIDEVKLLVASSLRTNNGRSIVEAERFSAVGIKKSGTEGERYGDTVSLDKDNEEEASKGSRDGGDEFVISAYTGAKGARAIELRVRNNFKELMARPENADLQNLGIGLAIGSATLKPGMGASELIHEADTKMYQNKYDQLPKKTRRKTLALFAARLALKAGGVRPRDFLKYEHARDKK